MKESSFAVYTRLLNHTEDYIEKNLTNKISLEQLATNVHLSPYHFHRIFKKYQQETVHQFVSRIKLERAAIFLLTNPDVSITELSFIYGYSDSSSFSRSFKKQFGMSPINYKKAQDLPSAAYFDL